MFLTMLSRLVDRFFCTLFDEGVKILLKNGKLYRSTSDCYLGAVWSGSTLFAIFIFYYEYGTVKPV